jgi:hypothetical protein
MKLPKNTINIHITLSPLLLKEDSGLLKTSINVTIQKTKNSNGNRKNIGKHPIIAIFTPTFPFYSIIYSILQLFNITCFIIKFLPFKYLKDTFKKVLKGVFYFI